MSQSYYFESYPPLFRPPPNIPQIQESNSDETESLLLDSHIPVIDYFKCTTPTIRTTKYQDVNEDRNLISEACRDWGLFRLVNHGIPITLLNQIEEHAKKLFSLPYETKKAFFANSTSSSNFVSPISYFWGSPALSPSGAALAPKKGAQENNNQSLQWMEGFNVSLAQLSNIHYQDLLLETFRCLLEEYGKELSRLATEIFKILGPFESNYMSIETGLLRVYRYPRCLEPERTWGIDTHTDSSVLSIIHQDDVGGLQVYKDHQWIDVNPLPNTLIVNIGDMLQAMSDDRFMSVKHRVKVNKHKERISIGYFVFPAEDTIIQSTKYNPFSYADFRAQVQHDLKTLGLKTGLQKFKFS
ncbi:gibberellin 2-beta-dioxygenase 8 [Solanum tuberosum]|uniref:20G-Fe(II) oxidoreductase n=3 Tax=Solanum tuberosum TaxID=4113 RepID=M1CZB4_SOLTU|nr:PREDICTED: gibberellin 2-beta-dioxygenase 8 [Solanum tuberosum]